jgi:hypothetical protein
MWRTYRNTITKLINWWLFLKMKGISNKLKSIIKKVVQL